MLMTIMMFAQKKKEINSDLIKGVNNELRLDQNKFYDISLNQEVKLRDILIVDRDFKVLEPLGKPNSTEYKKSFAYEHWSFKYDDMELYFIDRSGRVEIQSIKLFPNEKSHFKLGDTALRATTKLEELVSSKSVKTSQFKGEVPLFITSDELVKNPFIHINITLDGKDKKVKSIVIRFETT